MFSPEQRPTVHRNSYRLILTKPGCGGRGQARERDA